MRKIGMSIGVIIAISSLCLISTVLPLVHGSTLQETHLPDQKHSKNVHLVTTQKGVREHLALLLQKLGKNHDGEFMDTAIQNVIPNEGKNLGLSPYGLTELLRVVVALILLLPTFVFVPFGIVMAVIAYMVSLVVNVNILWEIAIAFLTPFVTCLVVLDYTGTLSFTASRLIAIAIIKSYLPIP